MDPKEQTNEYLKKHKLAEIFEEVTAQLLFHKPDDPKDFICRYLEQVQASGSPALLNGTDLDTMFEMFDITHRGVISSEQVTNALTTILGKHAPSTVEGKAYYKKEEFVSYMQKALHTATPYKK